MLKARDVAMFFLTLDKDGILFDGSDLLERNGRTFYKGNARLNKYLHLAQNIYYAKTGELLFSDKIYAYDNGGVIPEVQERYKMLIEKKGAYKNNIPKDTEEFLLKLYIVLENAPVDKLIELSHEDPEWINRHNYYSKDNQVMNTESHYEEYKDQYYDIIRIMDGMKV